MGKPTAKTKGDALAAARARVAKLEAAQARKGKIAAAAADLKRARDHLAKVRKGAA